MSAGTTNPAQPELSRPSRLDLFFSDLGPGLITGCADDDPSGISTYSVAGAVFGYGLLWTALLSFPLMVSIQTMCGRLGIVTGYGLAEVIRRRYPRWVLWVACGLLVTANVINIGADLGGMGEVAFMVTGIKPVFWTVSFTLVIVTFLFRSSYRQIARVFKWITLVLLSYVLTAFFAHVQWRAALLGTVRPHLSWSREYLAMFVAVMGTTISPYLFFWQAAQEVEDGRIRRPEHERGKPAALRRLRMDVAVGMFFSNFIMYFIILTTAATLHAHGTTQIETAGQAAEALRPLAGKAAYWLFTFGLIGTGTLGVPILAGSSAYALAEAAAWRGALQSKPHRAKEFYAVLAAAMTIGLAIDFLGLDAVKMLFLSAVVNGALAPPLILLVILLTNDPKVMGKHVNSPTMQALGWITFLVMSVAALGLLFS